MRAFSKIRLWQVIKKEFKQLLRDPKAKPLLLASPIVQFILLAYASTTDVEHIRTVFVDQDRTADSQAMIDAYVATGYFDVARHAPDVHHIVAALDEGDAVVGIIIPPGFSRDLHTGRGAQVQALIDGSDASVATVAQSYVAQVASAFGARFVGQVQQRAGTELRARAWYNPSLKSRLFNVPAIMGTLLITTCLMLTTMALVREREVGTMDQLLVSPVKASEIMVGKTVPTLVVGLFHLCIFMGLTLFHFAVPFRGTALALLVAALLFLLSSIVIGLFISAVSRTQQEAFMLMILCMLPTIVLSGFLSPIESMPEWLQWVTVLNPVRHFMDIVRGVFLRGTGIVELWPQYLALLITVGVGMRLATWRFRQSLA